mgnify:CR=1 FL=1
MALLGSSDYPAIRAAIDISLTATDLPDATIALDLYAGAAERWVLGRDPDAASRTGDDALRVKEAAVCACAALLLPALPAIRRETHGDDSYERQVVDPEKQAAALWGRASAAIDAYLAPDDDDGPRPTFFALASGRRVR